MPDAYRHQDRRERDPEAEGRHMVACELCGQAWWVLKGPEEFIVRGLTACCLRAPVRASEGEGSQ